jgi:hypothetical protein
MALRGPFGEQNRSLLKNSARTAMRAARLAPRINRATAEKLLADFLQCVEEVNAHPDLLHWVTEVRVFGSYLTNSDDLGEIDLAIKKERRPVSGSFSDACVAFYSQRLVARLLKGGSRYILLHGVAELDENSEFGGKRSEMRSRWQELRLEGRGDQPIQSSHGKPGAPKREVAFAAKNGHGGRDCRGDDAPWRGPRRGPPPNRASRNRRWLNSEVFAVFPLLPRPRHRSHEPPDFVPIRNATRKTPGWNTIERRCSAVPPSSYALQRTPAPDIP